jgi:hypothetical protein
VKNLKFTNVKINGKACTGEPEKTGKQTLPARPWAAPGAGNPPPGRTAWPPGTTS